MPSVGSWHDALAACEDDEQANEASPASLMFIAPTQSAGAEKPHSRHTKLLCVLRFCPAVWRHSGHLRLVFWGGTATRRPPFHCVLYSSWRRSSNGLASRIERLSPDFGRTCFPGFAFLPSKRLQRLLVLTVGQGIEASDSPIQTDRRSRRMQPRFDFAQRADADQPLANR